MRSPILFVVFNRPDVTSQVFDAIRLARPPRLYIAADGPRKDRVGEAERCRAVQEIVSKVDWSCEVKKLIREKNLGCKKAVSSAIDWFFSQEPEGIILEDDCLPHPDFFTYCDELLERYRNDERVGMISGCNFQNGTKQSEDSYYFSRFYHIWGWASWARAWKNYDVNISRWPKLKKDAWLIALGFDGSEKRHWEKAFDRVYAGEIDTWDHQWTFASWLSQMLSITPAVNLVSNIGFGAEATHTTGKSIFSNMQKDAIQFPLKHPIAVIRNSYADNFSSKNLFTHSYIVRGIRKLKAIFLT
jgi:hypothetical protein